MAALKRREIETLAEIEARLDRAADYASWLRAARDHDRATAMDEWRRKEKSRSYDYEEIRGRLDQLRGPLRRGDVQDLLYTLNEGIHGNMGGMGRGKLYTRARAGTKTLIRDYIDTIVESLHLIADAPDSEIPLVEKVDFFRRASHCYGRSALMLSGGAGVIYFHHGVIQSLLTQGLLPNVLSGASAGSWLCAQIGTRTDEELLAGHFDDFRYRLPAHLRAFKVLSGRGTEVTPLDVKEMAIDSFANDMTFQEAYEHTGRYISISIAPVEKHQASRLLNAITSPNVYIRSAIDASSSVPGLVPPVRLYAKGADGKPKPYLPSRKWVDGSFAQDLPAKRLARLFGVNHFIVSLINPLAVPFVRDPKTARRGRIRGAIRKAGINVVKEAMVAIEDLVSRQRVPLLGPAILMAHGLLDQEYTGDINIILQKRDFRWMNVLFEYRGDAEIAELIDAGRRSTWPRIQQIRNASVIARTLDTILERIDRRELGPLPRGVRHITA